MTVAAVLPAAGSVVMKNKITIFIVWRVTVEDFKRRIWRLVRSRCPAVAHGIMNREESRNACMVVQFRTLCLWEERNVIL